MKYVTRLCDPLFKITDIRLTLLYNETFFPKRTFLNKCVRAKLYNMFAKLIFTVVYTTYVFYVFVHMFSNMSFNICYFLNLS